MKKQYPQLLIADENGNVTEIPELEAIGMKAGVPIRLKTKDLIKLPKDSELFLMPDRSPLAFDPECGSFVAVEKNPFSDNNGSCYAVSAFLSPGHTTTYNPAYIEAKNSGMLPLFSYAAVVFYRNEFYVTGKKVDHEKRQDLSGMDMKLLGKNVKKFQKTFPDNRLVRHLETCALCYGCPAAKNYFLQRYECPLPTSPTCNSLCIGCISYQPGGKCSVTQPRIKFKPTPEEIAEVALSHIKVVKDPVVSFGQGCEGEPLMVGDILEKAIKLIRRETGKGVINLNTNASKPVIVKKLLDAGLDSIRVSMNSACKTYYDRYYRPQGYTFSDVKRSIAMVKKAGKFVSINYLVMPGYTDQKAEVKSFMSFIEKYQVDMIQWRNLNFDPLEYTRAMKMRTSSKDMMGIDVLIDKVAKEQPRIMKGYFNPSKGRMRRHKK
jgi:MoaA/NifB/PqqE/SkfB family radical SAM enzyme